MKLKKSQIFTIAVCLMAVLMLSAVLLIGLSANGFAFSPSEKGPRSENLSYDVDLNETPVNSLDVTWQDGPITLTASPDGNIHVIESSRKKISDSDSLELSVKSGTLTLRWDGKWYRRFFNLGFGQHEKALEIQLPQELAGSLEQVSINNTSGDISLGGLTVEEMELSSISGGLDVSDCKVSGQLSLNNVSGSINLDGASAPDGSPMEDLDADTVSGVITISNASALEVSLNMVSGKASFDGSAGSLKANSVSGDIQLSPSACPEETDMDTVSGQLILNLPRGSEFTAEYDTLSGSFSTGFPAATDNGRVRVGSAGNKITMNTTSGNMSINQAN